MSRLDWKRGRFSIDYETNEIQGAIRGRQDLAGDQIDYYRFNREETETEDLYDESTGAGRVFDGPIPVPVMHVTREEGPAEERREGYYYNDQVHITAGYDMLRRTGLTDMDINTQAYVRDRLVYDDRVFRVMSILVLGQIQRRDIIVAMDATQMRPDELTGDPQFIRWAITATP